jgi:endogenous inhibitor of DNA gyrase (YacG/DUF329 family)
MYFTGTPIRKNEQCSLRHVPGVGHTQVKKDNNYQLRPDLNVSETYNYVCLLDEAPTLESWVPEPDIANCSICGRDIEASGKHKIGKLPCGHVFGLFCLYIAISESKQCPTCQMDVEKDDIESIRLAERSALRDGPPPLRKEELRKR